MTDFVAETLDTTVETRVAAQSCQRRSPMRARRSAPVVAIRASTAPAASSAKRRWSARLRTS